MATPAPAKKLSIVFLLVLTSVFVYLAWVIARPFLVPIITAALLAIAIFPLFRRLLRLTGNSTASALLTTLLVLVVILVPTVLLINKLAHDIAGLYGWLNEQQSQQGSWSEYFGSLAERPLQWVAERTGVSREQLRTTTLSRLQAISAAMVQWGKSLVINIGATVVDLFTTLLTLFFFLRDGERLRNRIGRLLPMEPLRYQELVSTIVASIEANVYGVLSVALAQGILGAIGYTIVGLPSVMLWSVVTAAFSLVPVVGTACVWVVACGYLAATASWGKAVFMLAWGAGIISSADNIVRPLVLSGRVKMNTLLIFFSLLGGAQAFGVIGLFLGPMIVSVVMALLRMLEQERMEWEKPDPGEPPQAMAGQQILQQ